MTVGLGWPPAPHDGGSFTDKLTRRNIRKASMLRRFDTGVLSLVSVVTNRYWDRGAGAGGPGHCGGAWINEGSVWLRPYPLDAADMNVIPPMRSVAGWSWQGSFTADDGQVFTTYETADNYLQQFQQSFWTVEEALHYANSVKGTSLSEHSEIVERALLRKMVPAKRRSRGRRKAHPELVKLSVVPATDQQGELL